MRRVITVSLNGNAFQVELRWVGDTLITQRGAIEGNGNTCVSEGREPACSPGTGRRFGEFNPVSIAVPHGSHGESRVADEADPNPGGVLTVVSGGHILSDPGQVQLTVSIRSPLVVVPQTPMDDQDRPGEVIVGAGGTRHGFEGGTDHWGAGLFRGQGGMDQTQDQFPARPTEDV